MEYITTNIRLFKDDYQRLKQEAAQKRKSLSAVIREKLRSVPSRQTTEAILAATKKHARENASYLTEIDGTQAIREIRYEDS